MPGFLYLCRHNTNDSMKKIAIFASGEGTNAEAIARHFRHNESAQVALLVCNRKAAGAFDRIKPFNVPAHYFPKAEWTENGAANVLALLQKARIDLIVLAGFLAIIPPALIRAYSRRIVNIHPSLLPKFGGPGMWGNNVHQAVINAGETQSGITIHYVSNQIDSGEIIFQAACPVEPGDSAQSLADRVHQLEYRHFPIVVEKLLKEQN